MKIVKIIENRLYAVCYDDQQDDEYTRLFYHDWNDIPGLIQFFLTHNAFLQTSFWKNFKLSYEDAAYIVFEEAMGLEEELQICALHADTEDYPDLNSYFQEFGGEFLFYVCDYVPVKAYGTNNPSLIRLYALRITDNCYLIVGGGIKLAKTIQESPGLEKVISRIKQVQAYLKEQGVISADDLLE